MKQGEDKLLSERLSLKPMDVYKKNIALQVTNEPFVVRVGKDKLFYTSDTTFGDLDRPVYSDKNLDRNSAASLYQRAEEHYHIRNERKAFQYYAECLQKEPNHRDALNRMAEIYCRRMEYDSARRYVGRILSYDTYDPDGNFIYGIVSREQKRFADAKAAFGWAARSKKFRSAAYLQIAEIYMQEANYERARIYAERALDYDRHSIPALTTLALAHRKLDWKESAETILTQILDIDPLNHMARYEYYLLDKKMERLQAFISLIRNEFPNETYLEIAVCYVRQGLEKDAIELMERMPEHPVALYWLAFLNRDRSAMDSQRYLKKAVSLSVDMVFPFRRETAAVLEWALEEKAHWKTRYYLGLIYWNKHRLNDAVHLFEQNRTEPDSWAFYLTRSQLMQGAGRDSCVLRDLLLAHQMEKNEWRVYDMLGKEYMSRLEYDRAVDVYKNGYHRFPNNFKLGLACASALLRDQQFSACIGILDTLNILPYEGASEGHDIYEQAHLFYAMQHYQDGRYDKAIESLDRSKAWPERLGVGAPFFPDTRLQDYIAAFCYQKLGQKASADSMFQAVYAYTKEHWLSEGWNFYLGAKILKEFGESENADRLMADWAKAEGRDFYVELSKSNSMLEWAGAKFNDDKAKSAAIEKNMLHQTSFHQYDAVSRKFIMLIKVVRIIEKE